MASRRPPLASSPPRRARRALAVLGLALGALPERTRSLELATLSPAVRGLLERAEPDALEFLEPAARRGAAPSAAAGGRAAVLSAPDSDGDGDGGPPGAQPGPSLVQLNVKLGEARTESVRAREGDDLEQIAAGFCEQHGLESGSGAYETVVSGLRDLLQRARQMDRAAAAPTPHPPPPQPAPPKRAAVLRATLRLPPAADALPPRAASLQLEAEDGRPIGTLDVAPGANLHAAAAGFVAAHGEAYPELRAYGAAQLGAALGALGAAVGAPPALPAQGRAAGEATGPAPPWPHPAERADPLPRGCAPAAAPWGWPWRAGGAAAADGGGSRGYEGRLAAQRGAAAARAHSGAWRALLVAGALLLLTA